MDLSPNENLQARFAAFLAEKAVCGQLLVDGLAERAAVPPVTARCGEGEEFFLRTVSTVSTSPSGTTAADTIGAPGK